MPAKVSLVIRHFLPGSYLLLAIGWPLSLGLVGGVHRVAVADRLIEGAADPRSDGLAAGF